MQEDKLYDTLLNLPLFLGMSRADLLQIAGHTKFDFQKIEGGETLTEIGEPYHRLLFLLSGEVAVETMADDRGYRIVETIKAGGIHDRTPLRIRPALAPSLCGEK